MKKGFALRKSNGFTLIELMVVIVIIALLSGFIMVNLNNARERSRDAKRKQDIASIQIALEMYKDKNGTYPVAATWVTSNSWPASFSNTLQPSFISVMPKDPINRTKSGTNYTYQYKSVVGNQYTIKANAMESTEGKAWAKDDGNDNTSYEVYTGTPY